MPSEIEKDSKPTVAQRMQFGGLLLVTFLSRVFFLNNGFGAGDGWRVGVTGKLWVESGEYLPSRPPGFPLTESASALCFTLFGVSPLTWIATNLISTLFFCLAVWGVWSLAWKWKLKSPIFIAAVYAFIPLNWVYSVQTIDYLWYTALVLLAVNVFESNNKNSLVLTGVILGLAASARFFAVTLLIPILILSWMRDKSLVNLLKITLPFALISICAYAFILFQIDDLNKYREWFEELNAVRSGLAELEGGWFNRGFLLPSVRLFGPLASVMVVIVHLAALPNIIKLWKIHDRAVIVPILFSFFIMTPYLWHMHPYYWIPATGFMLILLSRTINHKLLIFVSLIILAANIPWWQNTIEQPRFLAPHGGNAAIENVSNTISKYQCLNVFGETSHERFILDSIVDHLNHQTGSDWVIMANIRLPVVQFLTPGIQRIDLDVDEGNPISVWGLPGNHHPGALPHDNPGATYKHMLSPDHVRRLVDSGYHVIWLPGMEQTYYAAYEIPISEVDGIEILFED